MAVSRKISQQLTSQTATSVIQPGTDFLPAARYNGSTYDAVAVKLPELYTNIKTLGAIGDGTSHPLSASSKANPNAGYANIAAAQVDYPNAVSLTQEIDQVVIEYCINQQLSVFIPEGTYMCNYNALQTGKTASFVGTKGTILKGADQVTGTARSGATGTTIPLQISNSSTTNDFYNGLTIVITGGTGSGQSRPILDYVGSTQTATVATWDVTPDNTSTYAIRGGAMFTMNNCTMHWQDLTFDVNSKFSATLYYPSNTNSSDANLYFVNGGIGTNAVAVNQTTSYVAITGSSITYTSFNQKCRDIIARGNDNDAFALGEGSARYLYIAPSGTATVNAEIYYPDWKAGNSDAREFDIFNQSTNVSIGGTRIYGLKAEYNTNTRRVLKNHSGILRCMGGQILRAARFTGTAQSPVGDPATTITLASGESSTNDFYNDLPIAITSGTGVGQQNYITDYVGSTKVATVLDTWTVNPDNTSTYTIGFIAAAPVGGDPQSEVGIKTVEAVGYAGSASTHAGRIELCDMYIDYTGYTSGYINSGNAVVSSIHANNCIFVGPTTAYSRANPETGANQQGNSIGFRGGANDLGSGVQNSKFLAGMTPIQLNGSYAYAINNQIDDPVLYGWQINGTTVTGTAQAGGATSITLASGASSTNDFYNDLMIVITGGTGAGQQNYITDYVGSTKEATVLFTWATNPDNTSTYTICRHSMRVEGNTILTRTPGRLSTGTYVCSIQGVHNETVINNRLIQAGNHSHVGFFFNNSTANLSGIYANNVGPAAYSGGTFAISRKTAGNKSKYVGENYSYKTLIHQNVVGVGNVGTGTDTLQTFSVPAYTMQDAGQGIEIEFSGEYANNANAKTFNYDIGGTDVIALTFTTSQAGIFEGKITLLRTGSNTQYYKYAGTYTGAAGVITPFSGTGTLTKTDTSAITVKGEGVATSNNDVVQSFHMVSRLN